MWSQVSFLPQQQGQESGKSGLMRCRIRPTGSQPLNNFWSRSCEGSLRFLNDRRKRASEWWSSSIPLGNCNPYQADMFAAIRHPVDQPVSEYHYRCTRGSERGADRKHQCKNVTSFILNAANPKQANNFDFPRDGFHWISQRDFIVGPLLKPVQATISCK
jgi:hypothetical protein